MILPRSFYQRDTLEVSCDLLGKILVHQTPEGTTSGRIVEVEAYLGPEDRAAHSYSGRRTPRNDVMFCEKGHAYVYMIYGMYYCVNFTSGKVPGKPEAVLIRALEPLFGQGLMAKRRKQSLTETRNLTNGPGRLCMAMGITKAQNRHDLSSQPLFIEDAEAVPISEVVESTRVGVEYAGDWKDKLWRFYIKRNLFVSKP